MAKQKTYTEAIKYLEDNYSRAAEKGIVGNNAYEEFLVGKGILPTEEELRNESFVYDWFTALYYNQPHLIDEVGQEVAEMVLRAALDAAQGNEDFAEFIKDVTGEDVVAEDEDLLS